MNQYLIEGEIEFLLFCPKAPDLEVLKAHYPPSTCPGHPYTTDMAFYVEAPDEDRAIFQALVKVKGALAWPQYPHRPAVTLIEQPGDRQNAFDDLLSEREPITISGGAMPTRRRPTP